MKRKGFYIKKNDKGLYLNIFKPDFVQYINPYILIQDKFNYDRRKTGQTN